MFKYHCLNPIANIGLNRFTDQYTKTEEVAEADAILVRSASMHDMEMPAHLKAIARAGAGVNNIPLNDAAEKGIVVFNTPGANANGVKELVIAGMLLASRDIAGGISWVQENKDIENLAKVTEKQKKHFAGNELDGKKLGVIGLGAIGVRVANAAVHLGMDVLGYDPFVSVDAAWKLSRNIQHIQNVEDIYKECDYITIHVPAMAETKGMISKEAIAMMKSDAVVLNFARDVLVDEAAMVEALDAGIIRKYVSDFPNPTTAANKNTIVIPHLGASTEESEDNCAKMAVREVIDFLENGNINHSVNYPDCDMGICKDAARITIMHKNIPNMLGQFTNAFAQKGINISDMTNKSRGEYAYTMMDVQTSDLEEFEHDLQKIDGVLKVRVIA